MDAARVRRRRPVPAVAPAVELALGEAVGPPEVAETGRGRVDGVQVGRRVEQCLIDPGRRIGVACQ